MFSGEQMNGKTAVRHRFAGWTKRQPRGFGQGLVRRDEADAPAAEAGQKDLPQSGVKIEEGFLSPMRVP